MAWTDDQASQRASPPPQHLDQTHRTGPTTIVQGYGRGVGGKGGEKEADVLARSQELKEENGRLEVDVDRLTARRDHLRAAKARNQGLNLHAMGFMAPDPSALWEGTQLEEEDDATLPDEAHLEEEVVEQMAREVPIEQAATEAPGEQVEAVNSEEQPGGGHRLGPH